jgi:hypothetical protein
LPAAVVAEGRDEETSSVTQSHKGRSKVKIVSEPQVATAGGYFFAHAGKDYGMKFRL